MDHIYNGNPPQSPCVLSYETWKATWLTAAGWNWGNRELKERKCTIKKRKYSLKGVKMDMFLVPISRLTDGLLRRRVESTLEADIPSFLYSTNTKLNTRHAHENEHLSFSFVQCRGWLRTGTDIRSWVRGVERLLPPPPAPGLRWRQCPLYYRVCWCVGRVIRIRVRFIHFWC